jgi:AraC family transcriptional activator of pobA
MSEVNQSMHFKTISQLHQAIGIAKPQHPLFSIIRFEDFPPIVNEQRIRLISDFYQITLKTECACKIQYGHTTFDFDEGVISCFAPKQVHFIDKDFVFARSGWQLSIHPDFLRNYSLSQKIKSYGFFDYVINEALILSAEEQRSVESIFEQIEKEYQLPIDSCSQDVIIAYIDVLLSYCNRYYTRQFITRKVNNSEMLTKVELLLNAYYADVSNIGLPTAGYLAQKLNVSPKYLNDCLKQVTGQTTQQLIHDKLIEQAKDLLASTELSISEIAYQLGFEYSQSFNKLFKNKTNQTPNEYRLFFN